MEFAGNPSKMSKILASFNGANLGDVSNTGVMENARNEANTIENNFLAQDTVSKMRAEAEKAELMRDYESEVGGIQRGAQLQNDIVGGIGSLVGSGISSFGGGGIGDITSDTGSFTTGNPANVISNPMADIQRALGPGVKFGMY